MPEPSLLDYLKALLRRQNPPAIPPLPADGQAPRIQSAPKPRPKAAKSTASEAQTGSLWQAPASILLFVLAQFLWSPPARSAVLGVALGVLALVLAWRSLADGAWRLPKLAASTEQSSAFVFRPLFFLPALLFAAMAFSLFAGNRFTSFNVLLWIASLICLLLTFLRFNRREGPEPEAEAEAPGNPTQWRIALILFVAVIAFFRFAQFDSVPPEMNSDHAEKLFDVNDVLNGETPIFFTRNTGREPLQFYLSAVLANVFGTGVSFETLKLGTTLLGFLSLYYVYRLGEEFGGPWVGLFAALLAGVAYWPNVLARVGLRFILYPAFVAPTLMHSIWALRGRSNRHYLWAGVFLGVGLLGYTAFRIMPLLVLAAFFIYWLHIRISEARRQALVGILLMALVSLFVVSPLIRYALEPGSLINYRVATRLLTEESAYPGNPLFVFITNMAEALAMPFYDAGGVWLIGLLHRPALDYLSGALLMAGVLLLIRRYRTSRDWRDLLLLVSIPILMLPSALSIAFPIENPALNRAGGATVPIFVIAALALDALAHGLKDRVKAQMKPQIAPRVAWGTAIILLMAIAATNYQVTFNQYAQNYARFSWNSSELGALAADFRAENEADNAWVVAYPHWVDTRLVAIHAGLPGEDIGLWPDQLAGTLSYEGEKLFMLNLQDEAGLDTLSALYPHGELDDYESKVEGKDFFIYRVPAEAAQ